MSESSSGQDTGWSANKRTYVVVPACNEATVLGDVLARLAHYVPRSQIILVDDASTDATESVARHHGVLVLHHVINRGQGAALATGIEAALRLGADAIVTFDADHQHDPDDLPAMTEPVLQGDADVVLGTRFGLGRGAEIPWVRRVLLKTGVLLTRLGSRMQVTDVHNGFRVLSARAAGKIRIRQDRMEHASEILDEIRRYGLRYLERPVRVRYSPYSLSKGQKNRQALKLALKILFYKVVR